MLIILGYLVHWSYKGGPSHFPDYYLSNFYCISGQVLDPSYFGFTDPLTNTWRPKKYTGTFTFDNSFYLPLDNQDNFEKDKSGEGNHFTKNNFNGTSSDPNVVKDSPSGVVFVGPPTTGILPQVQDLQITVLLILKTKMVVLHSRTEI